MAPMLLFLLLSTLTTAIAQERISNISLGSSLSPTGKSSFLSSSGLFAFGFYPTGNNGFSIGIWFAGTPQKTVIWTANRYDPPVSNNATLVLTTDGRLILQQIQGQDIPIANAPAASSASMLDSGNFVLYNSFSSIIWQSFNYPTDTLLPGQLLRADKELVASASETAHSTGNFRLKMQNDGNVVLYPVDSPYTAPYAYWAGSTYVAGENATLTLDGNGILYVFNSSGTDIKNLTSSQGNSSGKTYRATIDPDGIFRLYSHNLDQNGNWSIEWSAPNDKCDPKGICGINGYCVLVDQGPLCICPPGFSFINQEKRNLGCRSNFVAESCVFKNENTKYFIQELENTVWEDSPYSILSFVTKDECKQACLGDCSCEAAMFQNQECRKQKLPLRFGKSQLDDPTLTFIKASAEGLAGRNETTAVPVPKECKKQFRMDILIIGVSCLAFAFIILVLSFVLVFRYRAWANKEISPESKEGLIEDVSLRSFTYKELEKATNGFSERLGRGSFGTVFKGALGQRFIAVKRLDKVVAEGEVEFRNEMRSIGKTHHRNLVRLLGFCHDNKSNRLLVYEYMSHGSLTNFLFNNSEQKPNWEDRVRISLNIARGILYLHEECETQIIHCDINPNNILMDDNQCAKIADFGMAKLLMHDQTKTFTCIRGTRGYVAPEWHRNQPITVKVDVYSFGIVFLEIICSRRSVDMNVPQDEVVLVNWVWNCFEANELRKLVQEEEVDEQKLSRMINIGLWCIQDEPSLRPSMKKVVLMLEGTVEIQVPPTPTPSFYSDTSVILDPGR